MKNLILPFLLIICFCSCVPDSDRPLPSKVEGMRPIYVTELEATTIESLPPQPIEKLGKIYYKDGLIYVNESNYGVHVIDNADPANPIKIKFLKIPGCRDIAIKGNYLYADNAGDLITIDITDLNQPKVTSRLKGVQSFISQAFPEFYEGYFECVEEERGVIIGWEEAVLKDPKCWR